MQKNLEKHAFALYYSNVSPARLSVHGHITIVDESVMHRIAHVLRLAVHDELILFDQRQNVTCTIVTITKKQIVCLITNVATNTVHTPEIIILLPLLKRHALEEALYACVELAASRVQLVITEKVQKSWDNDRDLQRLQAIVVAAAEQSKNFAFPELHAPIPLASALEQHTHRARAVVFAVNGNPLLELLTTIHANRLSSLVLTLGPEGDFTHSEYQLLAQRGFQAYALTPTVLRSFQALAVGLGAVRSVQ